MFIAPPSTKSPLIEYRCPKVFEAEVLSNFFFTTLSENFPYFNTAARLHYGTAWEKNILEKRMMQENHLLFCAWAEKNPIGFIAGTPPEGGVGTIIWLSVASTFQNLSIGKSLLVHAKEFYIKSSAHKIKLTAHSAGSVRFYLREGFVKEGTHTNHWWGLEFTSMACFL